MAVDSLSSLGHVSSEAAKRLVVLSGLKRDFSAEEVETLVGNAKRVRQLRYPLTLDADNSSMVSTDNTSVSAAILYRGKRDAVKAVKRLSQQKVKGMQLTAAMYGSKPAVAQTNLKRGRLIVRNLSFKCENDSLAEEFGRFGEITEVSIPVRDDGKKKGFGIVQFKSASSAAEAIRQMNGSAILGRAIAVDWLVAKDRYMKAIEAEADDESNDDDGDNDADGGQQTDSDNEEDDDNDESDDNDNNSNDDSSEDDDDDDDDDDDCGEYQKSKKPKVERFVSNRKPDVDEGRTVFVRNLSFDTVEDELEELMSKFGDPVYCRIVVDPDTEHSKGTAFVKFKSKESVDNCLHTALDETGGLVLDGRKLLVSLAVSRDKVQDINKQKKAKEKVDHRNLHLIRESLIRPGTKGAEELSKTDIAKRMKVEAITRQKLKNPDIFVSTTRLCVRNIPTSVDDHSLRTIFLNSSNNPNAKITECRIMRDLNRVGGSKLAKSRGYAFINFTEHTDALRALKHTNNNPEIFGENKRLIVEFSLENRSALLAKEKRVERATVKNNMFSSSKSSRRAPKTKKKKVPTATLR